MAPEYTEEGVATFLDYVTPANHKRRNDSGNFTFLAKSAEGLVGMIEFRTNNHVSLMFVDAGWQGRGVGRKLFERGVARCLQNDDGVESIDVHSSPYAVPVYEKLGFRLTGSK